MSKISILMRYTQAKPDKEALYWYRPWPEHEAKLIEITRHRESKQYGVLSPLHFDGRVPGFMTVDEMPGWFCGPVEPEPFNT